jgi:hypothetical protein
MAHKGFQVEGLDGVRGAGASRRKERQDYDDEEASRAGECTIPLGLVTSENHFHVHLLKNLA